MKDNGKYHTPRIERYNYLSTLLGEDTIENCAKQNYATGMVRDLIIRDYPSIANDEFLAEVIGDLQTFRNIMKAGGYEFSKEVYNKQPQSWKIQYRFPKHYTIEQINEEIKKTSSKGQKKSVVKRKENGSYDNRPFSRTQSPLCVEFYTKRGFTEKEGLERIKEIASKGAKAALKVVQQPSTEKAVEEILKETDFSYSTQFRLTNKKGDINEKRSHFYYDFYIADTNTLVEVNGDFFHANPCYYEAKDIVPLPSGPTEAEEIWARDKRKLDYAKELGYNVVVIWERELKTNPTKCKERLING
jgi:G:T-mismatch repair DNA endonuclease (very short patch repair protein)